MSMIVLTVTQLNRNVRSYLEYEMGEVCVAGEISNLSKPASGHFYFTLKDAAAQVRCVYFRNRHAGPVGATVQNGQQVVARGKLSLYEARGDYQLIVEQLDDAGQGDLYRQFELLKAKLTALGLFDAARKKPLPRIPDCIGVITSATGAALHDILTTLGRRFPLIPVIVYPSDVQGKQAAPQLINAVRRANHEQRCDVLILARGGGSIEDLWAFNDEQLAHAIANSTIPVVSGVGHETDFTIADFVADLRAATPTAAAESVVPDWLDFMARLHLLQAALMSAMSRFIKHRQLLLNHEVQKITSPGRLINTHWQTLDYLERHLSRAQSQLLAQKQHRLHMAIIRLNARHPSEMLQQMRMNVQSLNIHLLQKMNLKITLCKQNFMQQLVTLHAVSPLATLDRGYAIATYHQTVLVESLQVKIGDVIDVRLARGGLVCEVRGVNSGD
jgi:exodeoxyribonuclease VII large subunit